MDLSRSSGRLQTGCLVVVGLALIVGASFALFQAVTGALPAEDRLPLTLISAAFIFAGLVTTAVGLYMSRSSRTADDLARRNPGQPWRWRPEWEGERIPDSSASGVVFAWVFAIGWNLIALPSFILAWRDGSVELPVLLLIGLFPLVGAGLVISAIVVTLRKSRFKRSWLVLERRPIQPGSIAAGTIQTSSYDLEGADINVCIRCEHRFRSGKETSTRVVWEEETTVPRTSVVRGPRGLSFSFELPVDAGCPPTDFSPGSQYQWYLSASAEIPGVDYEVAFHVPVFDSGEPIDEHRRADTLRRKREKKIDQELSPQWAEVRRTGDGSLELVYRRFRAKRSVLSGAAVFLGMIGIGALLFMIEVPGCFVLGIGAFALLILLGLIDMILSRRRVVVNREGVEMTTQTFITRRFTWSPDEIERFEASPPGRSGTDNYLSVYLLLKNGKRKTVGDYIRSRPEAEWIARRMDDALRGSE